MSIKSQLSLLIGLATIDDDFADQEKNMIYMLGKANGMTEGEIDHLIDDPEEMHPLSTFSDDEKFEILYNVVQLMKIDREVYLSEIKYCEELAVKLGYSKKVISELSSKIYSDPTITADREALKAAVKKHQQ